MKSLKFRKSLKRNNNFNKLRLSKRGKKINRRVKKNILRIKKLKNSKKNKRKNKRRSYKARGGFVSYTPLPCIGPQHVGTFIGSDSIFNNTDKKNNKVFENLKEVIDKTKNPKITNEDIGKTWFGDPKNVGSDIGQESCVEYNIPLQKTQDDNTKYGKEIIDLNKLTSAQSDVIKKLIAQAGQTAQSVTSPAGPTHRALTGPDSEVKAQVSKEVSIK